MNREPVNKEKRKLPKRLTQADVRMLAEQWAVLTKRIDKLEASHAAERAPIVERHQKELAPIADKYDAKVEPLQEKADAIEMRILEWLDGQKRPVRIESKSAIAEFAKGVKFGDRIVNAEVFVRKCVERKIKDFWRLVTVTLKNAETVMGKNDMEEICSKQRIEFESSSLMLK